MKVVITGASGLLGRAIFKSFSSSKFAVIGLAFSRTGVSLVKLDLCDFSSASDFLKGQKPDIVVHCAAERRPDVVDSNPDEAFNLNVGTTKNLAQTCAEIGALILYISTDYVFDGTKPPYDVDDEPNPLNKYGEMKLEGEKILQNTENLHWCVLRVPVLYGITKDMSESAVTTLYCNLMKSVETKSMVKMNDVERRYPVFCDDVAPFVLEICNRYSENRETLGYLHFGGAECLTKYEMVMVMAKLKNISTDFVEADKVASSKVKRPYDCQLSMVKSEDLKFPYQRTTFIDGLKAVFDHIEKL